MIKKYKERKAQQAKNLELVDVFTPPGWMELTVECNRLLTKIDPDYGIDQIKEKFGTLRFYYHTDIGLKGDNDKYQMMSAISWYYEYISGQKCEVCGKWGQTLKYNNHYWLKTLCKDHALEYGYSEIDE